MKIGDTIKIINRQSPFFCFEGTVAKINDGWIDVKFKEVPNGTHYEFVKEEIQLVKKRKGLIRRTFWVDQNQDDFLNKYSWLHPGIAKSDLLRIGLNEIISRIEETGTHLHKAELITTRSLKRVVREVIAEQGLVTKQDLMETLRVTDWRKNGTST